jgi:hypothetical protein
MDAVYAVATVAFFGAMLLYVAGCARLGRPANETSRSAKEHS